MPDITGVTSIGLCFTSDVLTFDQNWHHESIHSSSVGGKGYSNDTQMIHSVKPKICTKVLKRLREKSKQFPATALSYSVVKLPVLMMLSQIFLNWQQVQKKVNHCSKKIKNEEKA